jgi:hypothetical protein
MIADFFHPYIAPLIGAAYNIQQTLEGLGLSGSSFIVKDESGNIVNGYWSPSQAIYAPFGGLIILLIVSVLFALCAAYVLARWRGVAGMLLLISIPGILNVLGLWPVIRYIPDSYVIGGEGVLGDVNGYLPILLIALLIGWSLIVIFYTSFNIKERFRSIYDHAWYFFAVFAGIFFVMDSSVNLKKMNLQEEHKTSTEASAYLSSQLKDYYEYCKKSHNEDIASCLWASDVQQLLTDYTYYDKKLHVMFGPKASKDIYAPFSKEIDPEDILIIRKQIQAYNDLMCPVTKFSNTMSQQTKPSFLCRTVPAQFCRVFPDGPEGIVDKYILSRRVALGSECIVPMLVKSRELQEGLIDKIAIAERNAHLRWMFYIFVAFLTGGKIANSTTKIFDVDNRDPLKRKELIILLIAIVRIPFKVIARALNCLVRSIAAIRKLRLS